MMESVVPYLLLVWAATVTILLIIMKQQHIKHINELRGDRKLQAEQTDAKEVSEKLKGIAKDEFSAMITHELNTPLVPILGYCKMLKTSMLGKVVPEQLEALEIIEKNAKRLESLIADIMDVRKLDLNKLRFSIGDLSIDEFFSNIDSDYKKILDNKKMSVCNSSI